jgi:hypothetical protein
MIFPRFLPEETAVKPERTDRYGVDSRAVPGHLMDLRQLLELMERGVRRE